MANDAKSEAIRFETFTVGDPAFVGVYAQDLFLAVAALLCKYNAKKFFPRTILVRDSPHVHENRAARRGTGDVVTGNFLRRRPSQFRRVVNDKNSFA
jgi:dephospho-CoA kinase